jgi:starvation-inducible DNA-binding protein
MMTTDYQMNIGIEEQDRQTIAQGVSELLADTYTLYLKTHNFHWNVVGPKFHDLHLMFEAQYTELSTDVDDVAERIRTLGFPAPGTYSQFAALSSIKETEGVPSADEMLRILTSDNETLIRTARRILPLAQEANEESTASLISDRMVIHEKTAWMLRSLLQGV